MDIKDIKKYRGYMPVRMEREDTIEWLGNLIGKKWLDGLWLSKYSGYHEVRYRFGDIQEAQLYMKDKSWKPIPLQTWLRFTTMDVNSLDEDCWSWIMRERDANGITGRKATSKSRGGLLDI